MAAYREYTSGDMDCFNLLLTHWNILPKDQLLLKSFLGILTGKTLPEDPSFDGVRTEASETLGGNRCFAGMVYYALYAWRFSRPFEVRDLDVEFDEASMDQMNKFIEEGSLYPSTLEMNFEKNEDEEEAEDEENDSSCPKEV